MCVYRAENQYTSRGVKHLTICGFIRHETPLQCALTLCAGGMQKHFYITQSEIFHDLNFVSRTIRLTGNASTCVGGSFRLSNVS
ncbi:hypothetical protein IFVP5_C1500012 [Vibrio parahaemolyticus]